MKTIIVHHVQKMWDSGLQRLGTDFHSEIEKIYEHLSQEQYDNVIVTNFEAGFGLDEEQSILSEFYPTVYDYCYGWTEDSLDKNYHEWVEGGNHSEVVLIDDWMKELEGEVYLCGAFDGECIEDMEIALSGAGINFNRIEHLIN